MTTYTFKPSSAHQAVNWHDTAAWVGGVVPNSADADVVFPVVYYTGSDPDYAGSEYVSNITISGTEMFSVRSVILHDIITLSGNLNISGELDQYKYGNIDLSYGTLTVGTINNIAGSFFGNGHIVAQNFMNGGQILESFYPLTIDSANFTNTGSLIAGTTGNLFLNVLPGHFTNLTDGTLTGGTYQLQSNGTISINAGSVITTDAANIILGGGTLTSRDPATGNDVSLTTSLHTIASSGVLTISEHPYTFGDLDVLGTVKLGGTGSSLTSSNLVIAAGGTLQGIGTVFSAVENDGIINTGGAGSLLGTTLFLDGPITGSGSIVLGTLPGAQTSSSYASLEIGGATAQNILFTTNKAFLTLDAVETFTGAISTTGSGDQITLKSIDFGTVTGYSYTGDAYGGTLVVQEGALSTSLNFLGSHTTADFSLTAGSHEISSDPAPLVITVNNSAASPAAAASVAATASITEGQDPSFTIDVTLHDVTKASGIVSMTLLGTGTAGAGDLTIPGPSAYSVTQSAAGDYHFSLGAIALIDDLVAEPSKTIDIQLKAAGLLFDNGTDTTIVHVTLNDGDQIGTAGDDMLTGTAGQDYLGGGPGDDQLFGLAGNDLLIGGAGNDRMEGGSGNDIYDVDSTGDVVVEADGGGTDTVDTTLAAYTLGSFVEKLVYTGADSITGTGNALDNVLSGGAGNDTLYGLDGADTLQGNAGADHLYGGNGADVLDGGSGADIMEGDAGNDQYFVDDAGDSIVEVSGGGTDTIFTALNSYTLGAFVENLTSTATASFTGSGNELDNTITGGEGNNTLYGLDGNDHLIGGTGADMLYGGAGDDLLDGGGLTDTMTGGAGNDTYIIERPSDIVVEADGGGTDTVLVAASSYFMAPFVEILVYTGTATISASGNATADDMYGGNGNDMLAGGEGNDRLYGNAGNDQLFGGNGNDVLDGGLGADTLTGGAGDDQFYVDNSGDTVVEASGGGTDTVRTSLAAYTLGANVENLATTVNTDFTGMGNALANDLYGGAGNDYLYGQEGNDRMFGNAGIDHLFGGNGDDALDGGAGADVMTGGAGNDTYFVDDSGDTIVEADGSGTDVVRTSLANYTLGAYVENMFYTGGGNFTGTGNSLANDIYGGAGNDQIFGLDGDDRLFGNAGTDYIVGGNGNDALNGGAGMDTLVGGAGNDTYYVDDAGDVTVELPGEGTDVVRATSASYTLGANVEILVNAGNGAFTGTGNELANDLYGGAGNDILYGLGGMDRMFGNDGSDQLFGGDGNDQLDGGTGADILTGGDGNDNYYLDNVGDVVVEAGSGGIDTVNTTLANYTLGAFLEDLAYTGNGSFSGTGNALANDLYGGAGDDNLYGLDGNDRLYGKAGADHLFGGNGDDALDGGAGADVMTGGTGDDTYYVDNSGDIVVEVDGSGRDTVFTTLGTYTLSDYIEILAYTGSAAFNGTGNALANILYGGAGNDVLYGMDGNDVLIGGMGADTLYGGAGDDVYYVENAGDTVIEAANGGYDTVHVSISSYTMTANVEVMDYIGSGAFIGSGSATDNIIFGAAGDDTLSGLGGNDFIYGNAGADTLYGGDGNDTLDGGAGSDHLYGGDGTDILIGGAGADILEGGAGNDFYYVENTGDMVIEAANCGTDTASTTLNAYTLSDNVEQLIFNGTGNFSGIGNALANSLSGGAGDDILNGGAGADTMVGAAGNDTFYVDNQGDQVFGGDGNDKAYITTDNYSNYGNNLKSVENVVYAGTGNFNFRGGDENVTVTGGNHDDTIFGGRGNNVLYGMDGNDYLGGGYFSTHSNTNTLNGGGGADILESSAGVDIMTGGTGADTFLFVGRPELSSGGHYFFGTEPPVDIITDFNSSEGDRVDLSAIDAIPYTSDDDAFAFIGDSAFTNQAGQIRFVVDGTTTHVLADLNGDGAADFKIDFTHLTQPLMEHDFIF